MSNRLNHIIILILTTLIVGAFPQLLSARRGIPTSNLALPVLIVTPDDGSATGFYLRNEKHAYLVTARHVLFTEPERHLKNNKVVCLSYPEDAKDEERFRLEFDLQYLSEQGLIRYHQTHDVVVVRIGDVTEVKDSSVRVSFERYRVKGLKQTESPLILGSVKSTRRFEDVIVSDDVFIFGYPASIGIKEVPQIEPDRPLLRKGIIAGKNRKKETIILDCPTYYGNSGGPVIEVEKTAIGKERYLIIGLVSEFVPFKETWVNVTHKLSHWEISNSGYSVVTPIDKALELISQDSNPTEPTNALDKK